MTKTHERLSPTHIWAGRGLASLVKHATHIDMNAASSGPPAGKHWTFADLMQFDETDLYEIYDGRLIPIHRPLPGFYHQLISGQLLRLLDAFIRPRALGKLLIGPLDVIMAEDNTAEPDLLFIARENAGIAQDWIRGTPDLIVEIISPSTIVRDRYDKLEQYARFGVKEYWIVDPANQSLEILALNEKRFVMHSFAAETGKAESRLLPGLTVDLAELFEPEDREVFWGERPPVRRAESPST